ncbi:MAG: FAD-dependent oxidoreductase, partial [Bacteriovoracaceae bacterium]
MNNHESRDVVIIGGGQSALATAYFLRRENIDFIILDANEVPGGAWTRTWDSLKLFSPKEYSSLPGWMMPPTKETYPTREEIINYLTEYEKRYEFDIRRPVNVRNVSFHDGVFTIETDKGLINSKAIVSATGNWSNPFIPTYMGQDLFQGEQIHSAFYKNPEELRGKRVL